MKTISIVLLGLFLLGAGIRAIDVWRPADGRVRESWRECDYAAVAKNYYEEGMTLWSPRIDWRGTGPGYAEMEFPVFPWATAVLYKIFGYNEVFGRILAYFFSLLTLLLFFLLARYLLPETGAAVASLFFVLSPLAVRVSNSLQPEGLMILSYIAAVYAFLRWLDGSKWIWFVIAAGATALSVLVKIPSAHIGILFLALILQKKGTKELLKKRVWLFGLLALLPGLIWYVHAHGYWVLYGNSLGLSNEHHWIGGDLFRPPLLFVEYLFRLVKIEVQNVWMPLGGLLALAVLWWRRTDRAVQICLYWLLAIGIYYLAAIRTTGDEWASYYHVVTVPAAALLFGAAAVFLGERVRNLRLVKLSFGVSAGIAAVVIGISWFSDFRFPGSIEIVALVIFLSFLVSVPLLAAGKNVGKNTSPSNWRPAFLLLPALLSTVVFLSLKVGRDLNPRYFQTKYQCALSFKPHVTEDALILVSGGVSRDDTGRRVAFNAPYMFLWMERKGFNIPRDSMSIKRIEDFIRLGARYFVLEKEAVGSSPGVLEDLRKRFTLAAECEEAYLFRF